MSVEQNPQMKDLSGVHKGIPQARSYWKLPRMPLNFGWEEWLEKNRREVFSEEQGMDKSIDVSHVCLGRNSS